MSQESIPEILNISDKTIQLKATIVLKEVDPEALLCPKRVNFSSMKRWVEGSHGFTCKLASLGYRHGARILGRTDFCAREVLIDEGLYNEDKSFRRRWPYVFAHEIGHVVVHGPLYPVLKAHGVFRDSLTDSIDVFTGKKILETERDFLEHQASEFAVFLLVPAATLKDCLKDLQTRDGLSESRRGRLYVDDQPRNIVAFDFVRIEMARIYGVSRKLVVSRLAEAGLLEDRRKVPVRIGMAMRDLLE